MVRCQAGLVFAQLSGYQFIQCLCSEPIYIQTVKSDNLTVLSEGTLTGLMNEVSAGAKETQLTGQITSAGEDPKTLSLGLLQIYAFTW